ncbi:MAG TPA: hypothetical protein VFY87_18365 [Geminicoccaceae bacterium]|nr:hypothetical protein [Geminicoccaceae bacterium]
MLDRPPEAGPWPAPLGERSKAGLAVPAEPPPRSTAGPGLDRSDQAAFRERVAACRRAYLALPPSQRHGSVQVVDLGRMRLRFGTRWAELRPRAWAMVEGTLGRELGPGDLYLRVDENRLYVLRLGADRREVERRGELLAADATARLCGTLAGGVAVRVTTSAFDLDLGLADLATFEQLQQRIEAAAGLVVGDGEAGRRLDRCGELQPRFRPTFHLRKRLVSAYQLVAAATGLDGRLEPASIFLPDDDGGANTFRAELDGWSLRQAIGVLAAPRGAGQEPGLIVPVHYGTLAAMRSRNPFTSDCHRLPPASSRRLVFEVLGLPSGLPQARVRELMAYLTPFCRAIVARVPPDAFGTDRLASTGIGGLSLAATALDPADGTAETRIAEFAGTARVLGMRSLLVEAGTARFCRAALAARADYVSGDGLMPPLPRPGGIFLASRHG